MKILMPASHQMRLLILFVALLTCSFADAGSSTMERQLSNLNEKVLKLYLAADYGHAETMARKAVDMAQHKLPKSSQAYQYAYLNLAAVLMHSGYSQEAATVLDALIEQQTAASLPAPIRIQTLNMLLQNQRTRGPLAASMDRLTQYIDLMKELHHENDVMLIGPINERGAMSYNNGDGSSCATDLEQALTIYEVNALKLPGLVFGIENNLALCDLRARRFDAAIARLQRLVGEETSALSGDDKTTLKTKSDLGFALEQAGRYVEALKVGREVLDRRLAVLGETDQETFVSRLNVASSSRALGYYVEAEEIYLKILSSYDDAKNDPVWKIGAFDDLADLYLEVGRYDEALAAAAKADDRIARMLTTTDVSFIARSFKTKAKIYERLGDIVNAKKNYRAFINLRRDSSDDPLEVILAYTNLATLSGTLGEIEEARQFINEALAFQVVHNISNVEPKITNARILMLEGREKEAAQYLAGVLIGSTAIFGENTAFAVDVSNALAIAYNAIGEQQKAHDLLSRTVHCLGIGGPSAPVVSCNSSTDNLATELRDAGQIAVNLALLQPTAENAVLAASFLLNAKAREKGIGSLSVSDLSGANVNDDVASLLQAYQQARAAYVAMSKQVASGDEASLSRLEELRQDLVSREQALRKLAGNRPENMADPFVEPATVSQSIGGSAALIEYFVYHTDIIKAPYREGQARYGAMILRGDGSSPIFLDLASSSEIRDMVSYLFQDYNHLSGSVSTKRRLYVKLLQPVIPYLAGVTDLHFSTSGILGAIPFDILTDEEGSPFIDGHFSYSFVASGRFLANRQLSSVQNHELVAYGGIDFNVPPQTDVVIAEAAKNASDAGSSPERGKGQFQSFAELPSSKAEVNIVSQIWKSHLGNTSYLFIGDQATEANLRNTISPMVLHLATHGIVLDKETRGTLLPSMQIAVALSGANKSTRAASQDDGIAFGYELQQLDLRGTRLVVLSACETGIGLWNEQDGIVAVERSFRLAGARAVMATLQPISDAYTVLFMQDFYAAWLSSEDEDPDKALRAVKLSWLHSGDKERSDPKRWSTFVIVNSRI